MYIYISVFSFGGGGRGVVGQIDCTFYSFFFLGGGLGVKERRVRVSSFHLF